MTRCRACRRPLTNPVSIREGFGPDCLRRAIAAGQAPLEALETVAEMREWKRANPSGKRRQRKQEQGADAVSADMFEAMRVEAVESLQRAADECRRRQSVTRETRRPCARPSRGCGP